MTDTEREALCSRIDELCAEVERLHADQAHWELGNCPSCPNVASLQETLEQNAKLRELVDYMTPIAWYAASERERDRMRELGGGRMSMISRLIDELNKSADEWNGSNMFELAHMCRDAADTIWELRDDLQRANAENAKLRELLERIQPTDSEGNELDIADTVHMLRSEYDGDHEWDDVIVELTLTKWGGDRWIVRGSKGEAWACDCTKTGYDEDAFEDSDDVEPFDDATLAEAENAKLRELCSGLAQVVKNDDDTFRRLREIAKQELSCDFIGMYDSSLGKIDQIVRFIDSMAELGIEVD